MQALEVLSGVFGKVLIGTIIVLSGGLIVLGFHCLTLSGERNVLEQTVKTEEANTARQKDRVAFYEEWMERDKLDAQAKEADYNRTMAAKPKFKTVIEYLPTGNECEDLTALINEARSNEKNQS